MIVLVVVVVVVLVLVVLLVLVVVVVVVLGSFRFFGSPFLNKWLKINPQLDSEGI